MRFMSERLRSFFDPVALLLALALVLQMLGVYSTLKPLRVQAIFAGALCIAIAFGCVPNLMQAGKRNFAFLPTLPAMLYLLWTVVLCFASPYPAFAHSETLRVFCGVCAYFLITGHRPAARAIVPLILACGVLQSCYDLYLLGLRGGIRSGFIYSNFATHEELGSFLLLLLPFSFAYIFAARSKENAVALPLRLVASGCTLFLILAFLIARCRSAWVGGAVAMLTGFAIALWYLWHTRTANTPVKPKLALLPVVVLSLFSVLVVFVFFRVVQGDRALSDRTATLSNWSEQIGDRWTFWQGGLQMARERPLTGWGPGSYVVLQNRWTGLGRTKEQTLRYGGNHLNIAHNYYAQWAADTGFTGLALHGLLIAFFGVAAVRGLQAHRRRHSPLADVVPLIAGIATIAGTSVDAIASPSYNFHAVSLLWWIALGVATTCTDTKDTTLP